MLSRPGHFLEFGLGSILCLVELQNSAIASNKRKIYVDKSELHASKCRSPRNDMNDEKGCDTLMLLIA